MAELNLHVVIFGRRSKNPLQKHSPHPLLASKERAPATRPHELVAKFKGEGCKQDPLFFLVLFYTWPYVESVCKMVWDPLRRNVMFNCQKML